MTRMACLLLTFGLVAPVYGACSSADSSAGFAMGTERGRCRSDGTCDTGLICLSDTCVDPTATPDASGVGGGSSGNGGSGGSNVSSGGSGNGNGGGGSGNGGGNGNGGAGGSTCSGAHPNVNGTNRFCDPGDCYCTSPFDTCFPASQITTCCTGTSDCGTDSGPGGVNCVGAHPIIGPPRTCDSGSCLCSDSTVGVDACYPQAIAATCCPPSVTLVCVP